MKFLAMLSSFFSLLFATVVPFVSQENPLLDKTAEDVAINEISSSETKEIISKMIEIAKEYRKESAKGLVGLAAPQIGILKKIILVDVGISLENTKWGELKVFINPKILESSNEQLEEKEGCYSVDSHVIGVIKRAAKIKVSYYTIEGEFLIEEFSNYTARILQHEIDHLSGIRFPDKAKDGLAILHFVNPDEYQRYKETWRNWPHVLSYSEWIKMKTEKNSTNDFQ